MVSRVLLPDPLGPMTATSAPASTDRSTSWRAWTSVCPVAVGLGHVVHFEEAHRAHPDSPPKLRQGVRSGSGWFERGTLEAAVGRVEPADDRVQPEQLGVDHEGEAQVEVGLVLLEARPLLHELDQVAAVDLDHVVDVDTRAPRSATSTLMTSSSRGGEVRSGGVRSHWTSSSSPSCGDAEALLGAVLGLGLVGLDEPVALEALQRRVHLAHVERPDVAGSRLELLAQLQAVLGPLAQQRQQGVPDTHGRIIFRSILRILLAETGTLSTMIQEGPRLQRAQRLIRQP